MSEELRDAQLRAIEARLDAVEASGRAGFATLNVAIREMAQADRCLAIALLASSGDDSARVTQELGEMSQRLESVHKLLEDMMAIFRKQRDAED